MQLISWPSKLWKPHQEELFCYICNQIDFPSLFQSQTKRFPPTLTLLSTASPRPSDPITWDLVAVRGNSSCPFCRLILGAISCMAGVETLRAGIIYGELEDYGLAQVSPALSIHGRRLRVWVESTDEQRDLLKPGKEESNQCIQLLGSDEDPELDVFKGRRINPNQVNFALIRIWLMRCETLHASSCSPSFPARSNVLGERDFIHFRVIDVEEGRVVEASPQYRYVALSYVWGKVRQVQLTRDSYTTLTKEGALHPELAALPRTIRDALYLCRELEVRYLWVDTLCIVQDDSEEKDLQIQHMDAVYRRAVLTIVATAGSDCDAGLPRVRSRKATQQHVERVKGVDFVCNQRSPLPDMWNSKWQTRAWTFQENVFSSRLLVFTNNGVFFYCAKAFWREDAILESSNIPSIGRISGIEHIRTSPQLLIRHKNLHPGYFFDALYKAIVASFLRRDLSREGDVLYAFAGLSRAFSDKLGPIRWGLPEAYFIEALLWRHDLAPVRRPGFPSWSWAGWKHPKDSDIKFQTPEASVLVGCAIDCYGYDANRGGFQSITRRVKTNSTLCRDMHPLLREHSEPPLEPESCFNVALKSGPHLAQLLCFYASSVTFVVDMFGARGPAGQPDNFAIRNSDEEIIAWVALSTEWRQRQVERLEFIVIVYSFDDASLIMMLIEEVDGIARRVQIVPSISQEEWVKAKPERRLVILS